LWRNGVVSAKEIHQKTRIPVERNIKKLKEKQVALNVSVVVAGHRNKTIFTNETAFDLFKE